MLGREVQKFYSMNPQVAMTFPLLVGTDGKKKMSQSLNNYISITDTPENIYGKIMSIPDEIMWEYFTMLTDLENILHKENLEIVSNNDWLSKLTTSDLVNLASSTT